MTFRNPLRSLPAGSITPGTFVDGVLLPVTSIDGLLEADQLAADAIDGKTITGATLQTAAAGTNPRLALDVTGLQAWDAAGVRYFAVLNSPASDESRLQLVGQFSSGTARPRVDVGPNVGDGDGAGVALWPGSPANSSDLDVAAELVLDWDTAAPTSSGATETAPIIRLRSPRNLGTYGFASLVLRGGASAASLQVVEVENGTLQVGVYSGANVSIDTGSMQARAANGATSTLSLNVAGGAVNVGASSGAVVTIGELSHDDNGLSSPAMRMSDGTSSTTFSSTSTTYAAPGAVGYTFTAPRSGRVRIVCMAEVGAQGMLSFEVRQGSTVGSGTVVLAANDDNGVKNGAATGAGIQTGSMASRLSLTAGQTYNVRAMFRSLTSGTSASVFLHRIHVVPGM